MRGILSQCIYLLSFHNVYFKYLTTLFVNYTSTELGEKSAMIFSSYPKPLVHDNHQRESIKAVFSIEANDLWGHQTKRSLSNTSYVPSTRLDAEAQPAPPQELTGHRELRGQVHFPCFWYGHMQKLLARWQRVRGQAGRRIWNWVWGGRKGREL